MCGTKNHPKTFAYKEDKCTERSATTTTIIQHSLREKIYFAREMSKLQGLLLVFTGICLSVTTCQNMSDQEPLALKFTDDTPFVAEYDIVASFMANKENVTLSCNIPQLGYEEDCSSGFFTRKLTVAELWTHMRSQYTLNVEAIHTNSGETVTLSGKFRVLGHQEKYFCSANMVNTGTQPIREGYLEFIAVGKGRKFNCTLKSYGESTRVVIDPCGESIRSVAVDYLPMERKVYHLNITNLTPGDYKLVVKPTEGCGLKFCNKIMRYKFTVAD
jgi:hypothetical protein